MLSYANNDNNNNNTNNNIDNNSRISTAPYTGWSRKKPHKI